MQAKIQEAQKFQSRYQLHAVTYTSRDELCRLKSYGDFLEYVKGSMRLATEKLESFESAIEPILPTNLLIQKATLALTAIFNATDQDVNVSFKNSEDKKPSEDQEKKLTKLRGDVYQFVRDNAFQSAYKQPCDFVYTRLDDNEIDYEYIGIECVKGGKLKRDFKGAVSVEWIALAHDNEKVIVIDSANVWESDNGGRSFTETPHGFDKAPVFPLLNTCLSGNVWKRGNTVTALLGKLNKALKFYYCDDVSKSADFFPIMWAYENMLETEFTEQNTSADGVDKFDMLTDSDDVNGNVFNVGSYQAMNYNRQGVRDETKKFRGMGTLLSVPVPDSGETDMRDPAGYIVPPHEQSKYRDEWLMSLFDDIFTLATGTIDDLDVTKSGVTKAAIMYSSQDRQSVLIETKTDFETLQKNLTECAGRISFNRDVLASVNYGDNFLLTNAKQVLESIKEAKEADAPNSTLLDLYRKYITVKYKNEPARMIEELLIFSCEPLPTMSVGEALESFTAQGISQEAYISKLVYPSIIADIRSDLLLKGEILGIKTYTELKALIKGKNNLYVDYSNNRREDQVIQRPIRAGVQQNE